MTGYRKLKAPCTMPKLGLVIARDMMNLNINKNFEVIEKSITFIGNTIF